MLKEYFTDLASHSYNIIGLTMDHLKKKKKKNQTVTSLEPQKDLYRIFSFAAVLYFLF